MPDVFGDFTLTHAPAVVGPWSFAAAMGPDARPARISCYALPQGMAPQDAALVIGAFQRVVGAAAGCPAPDSLLSVLGGGVQDGVLWLAEDAPTTPSLYDAVAASGPMPSAQVPSFLHGVAAAVEPLHEGSLYHSWLTPRSVFYDGAKVRISGWVWPAVLARLAGVGGDIQWPDEPFWAPETRSGAVPDARAEVFSAAALGVYTATGGPTCETLDAAHLPPALADALRRGLSGEPSARYDSVKEMVVDVTVEQAIAMTDQAETNAVPVGGDVPDWARDLLAETSARRLSGRQLLTDGPEPESQIAPDAAQPAAPEAPPRHEATMHVDPTPMREPVPPRAKALPAAPAPVFEWNVGEQHRRSIMPTVVSIISVLFVILGIAITVVRHH